MRATAGDDEPITGINVTPLVDIVLVLLVVLLVTTAYVASRSIPMELPGEGVATRDEPITLTIGIAPGGVLTLDGNPVERAELKRAVRAFVADGGDGRAVIAADERAAHGAVVSVVDLLRHEGLDRLAFATPHPWDTRSASPPSP